MKLLRRFLVIFIPPCLIMGLGIWILLTARLSVESFGSVGVFVTVAGFLLLPLAPVWAYPLIERMEDWLERR